MTTEKSFEQKVSTKLAIRVANLEMENAQLTVQIEEVSRLLQESNNKVQELECKTVLASDDIEEPDGDITD